MRKKILAVGSALLLVAGLISLGAGPATAGNETNTNSPGYWENLYPGTTCTSYDPTDSSPYGHVTDGKNGVVLNDSNQALPRVLIVKGGAVDSGFGIGNAVYEYPKAGTTYTPPLNNGNQQAAVSHWIVCMPTTPTPPVVPKDALAGTVSTTPAACGAPEVLVLADGTFATWGAVTYSGEGNLHYSVTATASDGHAFADGSTTFEVTGTLGAALTEGCENEPPVVPNDALAGAVSTTPATCGAPEVLVLADGTFATWGAVIYSGEASLHYSVTATALRGHTFENGETTVTVTGTLSPKLNGPACLSFDPPTLGLVTPVVASTNISCKADGSYTLGEANGVNDAIVWTVNGTVAGPGTYKVKSAGTVHVTAVPNGIEHAFEFGIDNPSTWTLSFTAAQACGDLTTLALPGDSTLAATGADSGTVNFGLLFAGGLLLLGGALLVADRKFRYGK